MIHEWKRSNHNPGQVELTYKGKIYILTPNVDDFTVALYVEENGEFPLLTNFSSMNMSHYEIQSAALAIAAIRSGDDYKEVRL